MTLGELYKSNANWYPDTKFVILLWAYGSEGYASSRYEGDVEDICRFFNREVITFGLCRKGKKPYVVIKSSKKH